MTDPGDLPIDILYLLIPLGLLLLGGAIAAFFWAVGSGQFDDLDSPGMTVLMDDDSKPPQDRGQTDQRSDR